MTLPDISDKLPPRNICLLGLQGSRCFGLTVTDDADWDWRGIYIAKTEDVLSLSKPVETFEWGGHKDDEHEFVLHELEKFIKLAIKGNPSVINLFFTPYQKIVSPEGQYLLDNKHVFLAENTLRKSFGGYAMDQLLYFRKYAKFKSKVQNNEKHVRHLLRLLDTGHELLATGQISFPLKNPEYYMEMAKQPLATVEKEFALKYDLLQSVESVFHKEVAINKVNDILVDLRLRSIHT